MLHSPNPLKSTAELGYLESSRICNNNRYSEEGVGPELLCTICQNVLWKPVACAICENTFCAACMQTWITKESALQQVTCPFYCAYKEKRAPPILKHLLSKLQIYCAYRANGCQEIISYDDLEKHEETCPQERTPCRICQTPVSNRDQNNKHEARQCFQQMYDKDPSYIQAQFMKLLDVVEASQKRIEILEELLGVDPQKKQ